MRKVLALMFLILGTHPQCPAQLYTDQQMPRPSPYQLDHQLQYEIQNMFVKAGHPNIVVDVNNGRVTLTGTIRDLVLKQDLVRQVQAMSGVNSVDDRITQGP